MRWNSRSEWIWSEDQMHEPIISVEQYEAAQRRFGTGKRSGGGRYAAPGRRYALRGLLRCGLCGRRMQGNWSHDRPHYRCRFAAEYPIPQDGHPRNIFIREDAILPALDGWLASVFDPDNLDATCDALAAASRPLPTASDQRREITRRMSECDRRLSRFREALVGNGDATVIGGWIAEAQREREQLAHDLAMLAPTGEISRDEARDLVESVEDLTTLISDASPEDKAALYKELGIELTYQPDGRLLVEARPRRLSVRVGGATQTLSTRDPWQAWLIAA
jgi:site-specific DNA recombinase